jgi:hypothetical protein
MTPLLSWSKRAKAVADLFFCSSLSAAICENKSESRLSSAGERNDKTSSSLMETPSDCKADLAVATSIDPVFVSKVNSQSFESVNM